MTPLILKIAYAIAFVGTFIIRFPHERRNKANIISVNNKTPLENILLGLVLLGMMILPLIYLFSNLLAFADYQLPSWAHVIGMALIVPMLWLFYKSHKDLGKNWSASLEIREEHNVVDTGVYTYIRHPMYSAIWLWAIIQALLLNNYIAGLSGIICFGILYVLRVGKEEAMMVKTFGNAYKDYMKKTKRIIPFVL